MKQVSVLLPPGLMSYFHIGMLIESHFCMAALWAVQEMIEGEYAGEI